MNKIKRTIPVPPTKASGVVVNPTVDTSKDTCKEIQDEGILKYEEYLKRMSELDDRRKNIFDMQRELRVSYNGVSFVFGDRVYYKNKLWFVAQLHPKSLEITIVPGKTEDGGRSKFPFLNNGITIRLPEYAMFNDVKKLKKEPLGTDIQVKD